jgi:acyl-coenzyme A synthetase/AMP-(fatty) acid ligase
MIANVMMGIEYFTKFSRKAVCGYNIKIVDENGTEVLQTRKDMCTATTVTTGTLLNLWNDNERF